MRTIIDSILDTDTYKLTMCQAIAQQYPWAMAEYTFVNRGKTPFPHDFHVKLQEQVSTMRNIALTPSEKAYLKGMCPWLKPTFLDLLEGYRFDPDEVSIDMGENGQLMISVEGPWYRTVLWEVPLMAIISELYFIETEQQPDKEWIRRTISKAHALADLNCEMTIPHERIGYADFGTRRRFSLDVQARMVFEHNNIAGAHTFVGTSNVMLARRNNIRPIGTQAHEWIQAHAAMYGFRMANYRAMEAWVNEYQGSLGIVLTDTYTTKDFFKNFDLKYAKLFDGVRQDSGEPLVFADQVIEHYKKLGIDPITKTIVFSDNLNVEEVRRIVRYCRGKIRVSFGIGTNLSNDVGAKPLNMVIKLTGLSLRPGEPLIPTVKLSDVPGKVTGDPVMVDLCHRELGIA
jgi:nicotinate phosphoribosyltransferase